MASIGPEMNLLLKTIEELQDKMMEIRSQQRRQETDMGALRAQVDALNTQIRVLQQQSHSKKRPSSMQAEWARMGLCGRCGGDHVIKKCPLQPFKLLEKIGRGQG